VIVRFCLYSILKNLRFADPFVLLFLLDLGSSYTQIGMLFGFGAFVTAVLEVPSGVLADRWGRISSVAACFVFYAVTFALFPAASSVTGSVRTGVLYGAATTFAIGEALRTGGHKSIMLDWLDSAGESHRATAVIGLARAFSKYTAALSALVGGLVLFATRDYRWLFYGSAAAALGGVVLMRSYPKELEGEHRRDATHGRDGPHGRGVGWRRLTRIAAAPGFASLFIQSVMFESQSELMLKYYLQPLLKETLRAGGMAVVGVGAVWIGLYEFIRGGLGGTGAVVSARLERRAGGSDAALRYAYRGCLLISLAVALCAWAGWLVAGLVLLVLLTVLQNARRPIFVSAFNQVMHKPQRATTLSLENQARSLSNAVWLPVAGWAADRWGLAVMFALTAGVLTLGLTARRPGRTVGGHGSAAPR